MNSIGTRFRAFLLGDSSIAAMVAGRIHEDHVPQSSLRPYIWFRKRLTTHYSTTDSAAGEAPDEFTFDVEVCDGDIRKTKDLAEYVRARCNCYRGAFSDITAKGTFIIEQDADYIPRNDGSDRGTFVESLGVQVFV
jgi:hypothetical protein